MSAVPFTVKAIFDYTSDHEDDLTFSIGQLITVIEEEDAEWYFGTYTDDTGSKKEGIFPRNFVEKYEPPAPPRPARPPRPKRDPEQVHTRQSIVERVETPTLAPPGPETSVVEPPEQTHENQPRHETEPEPENKQIHEPPAPAPAQAPAPIEKPVSPPPVPTATKVSSPEPAATPKPKPSVASKPVSSTFKDRIAAFNKPAAAPITPVGMKSPSSDTFVRKPFVPPPPSKSAYIPPPVEPPQVRRSVEERRVSNETPRPDVVSGEKDEEEEAQPKTSLKERIALLQKQQLEQATRLAEGIHKKEKPKKPPKKRTDSYEGEPGAHDVERIESSETAKEDKPTPSARVSSEDINDMDRSAAADQGAHDSANKEDEEHHVQKQELPRSDYEQLTEDNGEGGDEEGEEEEEEVDPEVQRRIALRERMAKMSGGMGMMGMFGPPGGLPPMPAGGLKKQPKLAEPERKTSGESHHEAQPMPTPLVPLPGLISKKPPPVEPESELGKAATPTEEEPETVSSPEADHPPRRSVDRAPTPPPHQTPVSAPPLPSSTKPYAPPIPASSRPPVPPTRRASTRSAAESHTSSKNDSVPTSPVDKPPAPPSAPAPPTPSGGRRLSQTPSAPPPPGTIAEKRSSRVFFSTSASEHPTSTAEKRSSRPPPPIPSETPTIPPQSRPPPPPPPVSPPRRQSTLESKGKAPATDSEEEVTEYEGDYDTDIAASAKHKDALKAHDRDSSFDEGTVTDEYQSPLDQEFQPPASSAFPRVVPPPIPSQLPKSRGSVDMPRAPPPPPPPPHAPFETEGDRSAEYKDNPFEDISRPPVPTSAPPPPMPIRSPVQESADDGDEEDLYSDSPPGPTPLSPISQTNPSTQRHVVGPPPLPPGVSKSRGSMDLRGTGNPVRRSMDIPRPSLDKGYIAGDIDLAENSLWFTQENTLPPVYHGRKDILFEIEESSSSKRSGKTIISKNVYILFLDYSQSVISVQFDKRNPGEAVLEQRHEAPPSKPRQDQLETAHEQFGRYIFDAVASKQNTIVGDGSPHALVHTLFESLPEALAPVGFRSYGALVYANLANASVQLFDEIRPGDIVTFRNARFQGHKGTMHQKYHVDVGKPDHVGVVVDWDGTKKKIRAWDQGRESKKVKVESFRLSDMRSGECRVWRVMPRSWVGWDEAGK